MSIFIIVLLIIVVFLIIYQLYIRLKISKIDSSNSKMKKKINFYKNKAIKRSVFLLMLSVCLLSAISITVVYRQNSLIQENKKLYEKIDQASDVTIDKYQENLLKLTSFPWEKVLESTDVQTLNNYEIQLSREWEPFFGESNISMIVSQKTKTLTVSIFPKLLSFDNFQIVEQNTEMFIQELQSVKSITMIDFNFTYRNEQNNLNKKSIIYSRETKDSELKKIDL